MNLIIAPTDGYNVTKTNDVSERKKMAGDECQTKLCNDAMTLNLQLLNCLFRFCALCNTSKQTQKIKNLFVYPVSDVYCCLPSGEGSGCTVPACCLGLAVPWASCEVMEAEVRRTEPEMSG